ncbi:MAG: aminotransferase class V-fold PLP-dependent enzyme [Fimbriimonadaceae bacterium]|nr:aminotransferase class V-fold PLP-dependent enzyme [Chitinophagales bacterium]
MDISKFRNDTPGCNNVTHFNNAGCSLHTQQVLDAINNYLHLEATIGGYETAALKANEINSFYDAVSQLLKCKSSNIAFAHSATDGYAKAISSIPFSRGDVILTTDNDYVSNQIQFISLQKRIGIKIIMAANLLSGEVDPDSIEENIRKHHPKLVAVTHVPPNSGMIQPVEQIGEICKTHDILYLVDACQSAGQLDVDINKIHCDFLSAAMRKFMRGPRGTGFLFVSDKVLEMQLEPMFIDMRGADWTEENNYQPLPDAKRFEYVELSYALLMGATIAITYALNVGLKNIAERNLQLCDHARNQLLTIPGLKLLDKGSVKSSIITIHVENINSISLRDELIKRKINTGAAGKKFAFIDFTQKGVDHALRISPHYYNTFEEIDVVVEAIKEIISKY